MNKNNTGKAILLILLVSVLLVSCGGQPPASPTPDMNALLTQSIGTLSASFFQTQTAIVPFPRCTLAGFSREDCVLDHLVLLQTRQQAAGLPVTPVPTEAEISAATAAAMSAAVGMG